MPWANLKHGSHILRRVNSVRHPETPRNYPVSSDRPLPRYFQIAFIKGRRMTITRARSTDPTGTKIRTNILQGKIYGICPAGVSGLESTSRTGTTQLRVSPLHQITSYHTRLGIPDCTREHRGDEPSVCYGAPRADGLEKNRDLRMMDHSLTGDPSFQGKESGISQLKQQSGSDHRLLRLIVSRHPRKLECYALAQRGILDLDGDRKASS